MQKGLYKPELCRKSYVNQNDNNKYAKNFKKKIELCVTHNAKNTKLRSVMQKSVK